ncbi:cytochrome o ubiquinol oxidase, subunit III, partial [mine drainage metagenome]
FHGLHVLFGVFWILLLLFQSLKHGINEDRTTKVFVASLYWHFVDVVWVVIFTLVYLAGKVG